MNSLQINFETKEGKKTSLRISKVKAGVTKDEAFNLANLIIENNIFYNGLKELKEVKSCEIDSTTYLV